MNYLKDRSYYVDLYDLLTIKNCLSLVQRSKDKINSDKEVDEFKLKDKPGFIGALNEVILYFQKGEEYRNKEKMINEWMERDRIEQEKYDNANEPQNVFCDKCNWAMEPEGKTLHNFTNEPLRVLFFFRCPKCRNGRGIFDDGREFEPKKDICPDCGNELKEKRTRKNEVVTTVLSCNCGYKNKDVWDVKSDMEESERKEKADKQLLAKYRKVFCLSKEDGDRYISDQVQTEIFLKNEKERKAKDADPRYQKARSLKKLKVGELQKLVQEVITANGFDNLNFDKPEIDRQIIIPFSVQDTRSQRSDYDASRDLRRSLTKAFEDTNWRLMSEGVSNRLGLLYGRLKGYEGEEDLVNIT